VKGSQFGVAATNQEEVGQAVLVESATYFVLVGRRRGKLGQSDHSEL